MVETDGRRETNIQYTAEFVVDQTDLLRRFPPKHPKIYADHSTNIYKPSSLANLEIGHNTQLKILARVYDEKGDALLVENPKSNNEHPHITLSCVEGVKPVYTNEMIKKAVREGSIEYFLEPQFVEVIEGYSDGKNTIISQQG